MENKDYTVEILEIIRSNTSPGIMTDWKIIMQMTLQKYFHS